MKLNISFLIGLTLLSGIVSCKKSFLDVPTTQKVVAEDYVINLSTSEEFFNGILYLVAKDLYTYSNVVYADLVADNLKPLGSTLFGHYSWAQVESDATANMHIFWQKAYNAIRSCNFLLERIDRFRNENTSRADAIKGQLFALRALCHDHLVRIYAQPYNFTADASHPGIPYDTIYAQTQQLIRQPVKDVYDHIVADLNKAISLIPASLTGIMPSNITPQTWISRHAAKALLARTYLFKGDYPNAKNLAIEVTAAVPLMAAASYPSKLFTSTDNESLFWFPPMESSTGITAYQGQHFSLTSFFAATTDLVNIIKERPADKRNNWFSPYLTGPGTGSSQVKKFPQSAVSGISIPAIAYYQSVIRSSEMYLTAAEACAKTGEEASARNFLDAIRQRADASASLSTASGGALLDSIYKERRKELCFENLRMYDLLRLGKGVSRTDVVSPAPASLSYPNDKAVAPIPLIDVESFGLSQNRGY